MKRLNYELYVGDVYFFGSTLKTYNIFFYLRCHTSMWYHESYAKKNLHPYNCLHENSIYLLSVTIELFVKRFIVCRSSDSIDLYMP